MKIITPITITDSMILPGTSVAEPAASETAWASGGTYAVGDKRIRTSTHRVYRCAVAHTGSSTPPESDPTRWVDDGPTARWAPFDTYVSTAATSTTSIQYVLQPGFVNALALYGLVGSAVRVSVKDHPGGSSVFDKTYSIYENAINWYEYLFVSPRSVTKLVISELPIRPSAEITITITAAAGAAVAVGMIVAGDLKSLIGDQVSFGGTRYGASAEPVTYSYINTDEYGNTKIVRRHKATSMRATVTLPRAYADQALAQIQDVLDVPVAFIAAQASGYEGLNVFGLASARVMYDSFDIANIDLTVKGLI